MIGSPFAGSLVARLGGTHVVHGVVLCVGALLVLIALTAHSLPALIVYLVLAGIANALAQPATNQPLAQRVSLSRQGAAFGAKYSAIPVASMLSGLAVPPLALRSDGGARLPRSR